MRLLIALLLGVSLTLPLAPAFAEQLPQSPMSQHTPPVKLYPKIVLYSTSWCPHCKAAKEYFTSHNIPFINRDVEIDDEAMQLLTEKYKSQAVPVIVIGDDAEVVRGFDEQKFEKILDKYRPKQPDK